MIKIRFNKKGTGWGTVAIIIAITIFLLVIIDFVVNQGQIGKGIAEWFVKSIFGNCLGLC
jgi:hypothetical protein